MQKCDCHQVCNNIQGLVNDADEDYLEGAGFTQHKVNKLTQYLSKITYNKFKVIATAAGWYTDSIK